MASWKHMTPAQRERARKLQRRAAYLRQTGRPVQVDPAPAIEHARSLYRQGMTARDMAARSTLSAAVFGDLVRGRRTANRGGGPIKVIDRDVLEKVLAVQYAPPRGWGAKRDGTGVRRRLQALNAAGFGGTFLAGELGVSVQRIHGLMTGRTPLVTFPVHQRVAELYDKYSRVDPEDAGLSAYTVSRARGDARRRGYAPAFCWEEWTIDDPETIPDWTGHCGTGLGMKVHRRDGIPVCRPCKEAYSPGDPYPGFDGEKLRELRERAGLSREEVGRRAKLDGSTVQYWETGRSKPYRGDLLDRVLSVLDLTYEDVCDPVEGT